MLLEIPRLVEEVLCQPGGEGIKDHILQQDQNHIRRQLQNTGLVAFVVIILFFPPQWVSNLPLDRARSVPFLSRELEVELKLYHGSITGMGIPARVTLIVRLPWQNYPAESWKGSI